MRPLAELFDPNEYYRFTLRHVALKYAHSAYNRLTADHPSDLSGPWEDHPYCKKCGTRLSDKSVATHYCCPSCADDLGL